GPAPSDHSHVGPPDTIPSGCPVACTAGHARVTDRVDLLAHFPPGVAPRPQQARLLAALADAIAESLDDPGAPRVFFVEAPPGVGKRHVAMALARWSGDAYLLTAQKLLP